MRICAAGDSTTVFNGLRIQVMNLMNKMGTTQLFSTIWLIIISLRLRTAWYMYAKWTLGRHQAIATRKLHERLKKRHYYD